LMGIGDWGLGIGDWGLGPIPNPQSPIPKKAPVKHPKQKYFIFLLAINLLNIKIIYL